VVLPVSDGIVMLRPFVVADRDLVLGGRDEAWARWLGPGGPEPAPTACIVVGESVVGWVDADPTPAWLRPGEANVGYSVFPAHRGLGYAARAVRLLAPELGARGLHRALLVIDVRNGASLGVARPAGARPLVSRSMTQFPTSPVYGLELVPARPPRAP
jgi:RimJ/RimL family protein N-acetyltransferase